MAQRSRYGVLLAVVLVFGALAAWSLPKLTLQNQLTAFFPPAETADQAVLFDSLKQSLNQDRSQQPLMVSVQIPLNVNITLNDAAAISQTLATALRDQSWVAGVRNAPSSVSTWNRAPLREYRYLMTDFDLETLPSRLDDLWQAWQMGLVLDKATALSDPTQQWFRYLGQSRFQQAVPSVAGVWGEASPSSDEQPEFIQLLFLVTFKPAALASHLQAVEPVLRAALVKSGVPEMDRAGVKIAVSNVAWIAQQARHDIEQDVKWLSVIATLLVLGFLFWTVPSSCLWVFLSFVPLATGTLLGTLAVQTVFGSIEAMTLALGVVLIGVAVDYPIHALAALGQSPQQAWRNWPVIRLGALSSLVGLGQFDVAGHSRSATDGIVCRRRPSDGVGHDPFHSMGTVAGDVHSNGCENGRYGSGACNRSRWLEMDGVDRFGPRGAVVETHRVAGRLGQFESGAAQLIATGRGFTPGVPPAGSQPVFTGASRLHANLIATAGSLVGRFGAVENGRHHSRLVGPIRLVAEFAVPSATPFGLAIADALNSALAKSDTPLQPKHFQSFAQSVQASSTLPPLDWPRFETLALDWQQALLRLWSLRRRTVWSERFYCKA